VEVNPAENPGERLPVYTSVPLPLPQEGQKYWVTIKDAYSGYS
jgi:hypothetical protein